MIVNGNRDHSRRRRQRRNAIGAPATLLVACYILSFTMTCHSFTIGGFSSPNSNPVRVARVHHSSKLSRTPTNLFESKDEKIQETTQEKAAAEESLSSSSWEWDGVPIEGSHDDEFDTNDPEDAFMPSMSFLSMANSVSSPALEVVASGKAPSSSSSSSFDVMGNAGKLHQQFMKEEAGDFDFDVSEDELLEMGGDPFFLMGDDDEDIMIDEGKNIDDKDVEGSDDDSDFFEWDGMIDEEAHLDLD